MAVCKHLPSKKGFGASLEYLTMQHSSSGHLLRDENGLPLFRERYLINGIHCLPETFAPLCLQDRIRFGKAFNPKTVNTHQYIISFAPSDADKGLTMNEAHLFGFHLAKNNFPGHRVLVCTHPDGSHQSGNIHVHIIVSSLRFEDRPVDSRIMRKNRNGSVKPSEYRAGCAHQDTAVLRKHLLSQINIYCRSHGYEICPEKASVKTTSGEYYLRKNGQETKHDQLRRAISDAAATTHNWEEFTKKLASSYTYQVPAIPPISHTMRQKYWHAYKEQNSSFQEWSNTTRTSCRSELELAFQKLRNSNDKIQKAEIRIKINQLKEYQEKERLFRKTYQTYARAMSLALRSRNPEDAQLCLEQMMELSHRCDGYWKSGWNSASGTFSVSTGTIQSRVSWTHITEAELQLAQKVLASVQKKDQTRKHRFSEFIEKPMPIEVKFSNGNAFFRHPDTGYWVQEKHLGKDYTLDALGIAPPRSQTPYYTRKLTCQR